MATATLIQAKVKYPSREPKDYGHGERINIVVTASNGEEIKIWGKPTDAIALLKKGESVQVIFDGKNHKMLEPESSTVKPESTTDIVWTGEYKKAIAQQITQSADLLAFCLQTAKSKFVDTGLIQSEESLTTLATTLFNQAKK